MKKQTMLWILTVVLLFSLSCSCFATPSGEDLLLQVPASAYSEAGLVTLENLTYNPLLNNEQMILEDALFAYGDLKNVNPPFSEEIATDPALERVSVDRVREVFESRFGPDSFSKIRNPKSIWGRHGILELVEGSDEYAFVEMAGGGDPCCLIRTQVLSTETAGTDLLVKVRFGLLDISPAGESLLVCDVPRQQTPDATVLGRLEKGLENDFSSGAYDEYLPVYTHTFRANGDGTYYWYSTELTQRGKAISDAEITDTSLPTDGEDSVTDTDGGTSSVIVTTFSTPVTDACKDTQSCTLPWILVGGLGFVSVVLVLLLFRKKKS